MRFETVLERLAALPARLPPPPAELEARVLGPSVGRGGSLGGVLEASRSGPGSRDAAALVLLYPDREGQARVILIERTAGPHVHAGQVALPGGKRDEADLFPEGTALREAAEEVGLDARAAGVTTVGLLDPVDVRVSGHVMVPVLATAPSEPALLPDAREVARLLLVPIRHFLPHTPIEVVEEARDGWRLRYGAYRVGRLAVWGATARVLGQLGALLGRES